MRRLSLPVPLRFRNPAFQLVLRKGQQLAFARAEEQRGNYNMAQSFSLARRESKKALTRIYFCHKDLLHLRNFYRTTLNDYISHDNHATIPGSSMYLFAPQLYCCQVLQVSQQQPFYSLRMNPALRALRFSQAFPQWNALSPATHDRAIGTVFAHRPSCLQNTLPGFCCVSDIITDDRVGAVIQARILVSTESYTPVQNFTVPIAI
ncbi:unnamed protein product [Diplocarpon coronariae]|nr:hypothetical protein JHW43_001299 [Diplocarpon mali]